MIKELIRKDSDYIKEIATEMIVESDKHSFKLSDLETALGLEVNHHNHYFLSEFLNGNQYFRIQAEYTLNGEKIRYSVWTNISHNNRAKEYIEQEVKQLKKEEAKKKREAKKERKLLMLLNVERDTKS